MSQFRVILCRLSVFISTAALSDLFPQSNKSYLNIRRVPLAVPPRMTDAREGSLWMVKFTIVGIQEKCGEGLLRPQKNTCVIAEEVFNIQNV